MVAVMCDRAGSVPRRRHCCRRSIARVCADVRGRSRTVLVRPVRRRHAIACWIVFDQVSLLALLRPLRLPLLVLPVRLAAPLRAFAGRGCTLPMHGLPLAGAAAAERGRWTRGESSGCIWLLRGTSLAGLVRRRVRRGETRADGARGGQREGSVRTKCPCRCPRPLCRLQSI